jgi:iron complex outermembrane receptor protein
MNLKILFLFFIFVFLQNISFSQDTIIVLPEVEIYGKESFLINKMNSIKPQSIAGPKTDIGTMLKAMPNTSGIRRGGTSIDPVFRGFRSSQLLILTSDGIRIEGGCPNRMDPVTSHIDAEEIMQLQWIQGSDMLQYGPAIGGVLVLQTIEPMPYGKWTIHTRLKSSYESNYNGFSNAVSINGGNKKFFFRLATAYKNYGNYTDGRGMEVNSSYQKDYLSIKTGLQINTFNTLRLNYTRSEARDVRFPALPMDENSDYTDIFNFSYTHFSNVENEKKEDFFANIYHVRVDHLMDNHHRPQYSQVIAPLTGIMRASSAVNAYTTGILVKKSFSSARLQGSLGIDIEQIDKDGYRNRTMIMTMGGLSTESKNQDNLWKEACIRNAGFYTNIKLPILTKSLKIKQEISVNIRYDYHQNFSSDTFLLVKNEINFFKNQTYEHHNLSFGCDYKVFFNQKLIIKAGISRTMRNGNMNELYIKRMPVGFDNYDYLGNPSIKPEINNQFDLGIQFKSNKTVSVAMNFFASIVEDYIGASLMTPSIIMPATMGVSGVKQFNNIGKAHFMGGELMLNSPEHYKLEVKATAGYTLAYLENSTKYIYSGTQVVGSEILKNDPIPEIPAMNTSFSLLYKLQKYRLYPQLDVFYTFTQNQVSESNYESSTPAYFLMNMSVKYKFKSFAELCLGANNLFDKAYYEHLNRKTISTVPNEKIKLYEPGRSFFISILLSL